MKRINGTKTKAQGVSMRLADHVNGDVRSQVPAEVSSPRRGTTNGATAGHDAKPDRLAQAMMADIEREASRARAAFAVLEHAAVAAREAGETMSVEWWTHFGEAYTSVRLAERAVSKAREKLEKAQ